MAVPVPRRQLRAVPPVAPGQVQAFQLLGGRHRLKVELERLLFCV